MSQQLWAALVIRATSSLLNVRSSLCKVRVWIMCKSRKIVYTILWFSCGNCGCPMCKVCVCIICGYSSWIMHTEACTSHPSQTESIIEADWSTVAKHGCGLCYGYHVLSGIIVGCLSIYMFMFSLWIRCVLGSWLSKEWSYYTGSCQCHSGELIYMYY